MTGEGPVQTDLTPVGDPAIIPADAKVEVIFDGALNTEGVAVAPDGRVWFSDITFTFASGAQAGHVWVHDPATGETIVAQSPSGMANGGKFDSVGNMYVVYGADMGLRAVTKTDASTGKASFIADTYRGRSFNGPNDCCLDDAGRVYFSDPRYAGHEPLEQPWQGVYRIDTDGTVDLVISDAEKPNGVGVSPDQKTLYVADHNNGQWDPRIDDRVPRCNGQMAMLAYNLDDAGWPTYREKIVDFTPNDGIDGFVFTEDGLIVGGCRDQTRFGVRVYSPAGEELAHIPTTHIPTNVGFARGDDANLLYIVGLQFLWRVRLNVTGHHPG